MEENDDIGRRRRELRDEKEKLASFSGRLAVLEREAKEADSNADLADEDRRYNYAEEHVVNGKRVSNYQPARVTEDDNDTMIIGDDESDGGI